VLVLSSEPVRHFIFDIGSLANRRERPLQIEQTEQVCVTIPDRRGAAHLHADYHLANFIVSPNNQIAYAAATEIATATTPTHNPLFIYGGAGLGKTHLIQAIGHARLANNPECALVYVTAERFVSEMVWSLKHDRVDEFKKRYRNVQVLLFDDVQFLARKQHSQREFMHLLNALLMKGRQLIITADQMPLQIPDIDERLQTWFSLGLSVALAPPDFATRVAILQHKAAALKCSVPEDVLTLIAQQLRSNVRELDGALRRVVAVAQFTGVAINQALAAQALHDFIAAQKKQITIERIQETVAAYYEMTVDELVSPSRARAIARPRQLAMALTRRLTRSSLPVIGRAFGQRDHATVLYAVRHIETLRRADVQVEHDYQTLLQSLQS
jgi:chromosomal replication initiator protein